jgi:hypothetical protein
VKRASEVAVGVAHSHEKFIDEIENKKETRLKDRVVLTEKQL